jgi:hypothetical protein
MSTIFVSHSSSDKSFVRKLAVDLLHEGLPVWLDEWELEIGDSLIQRIYDGIDGGSHFILVISAASIDSGWVAKEMTAALVKEEQISKRFLIPILLDDSKPPLQVADRLYADFSKGYSAAFEKLSRRLKSEGLHKTLPSQDRILVPLSFVEDTHLDTTALEARMNHLRPLFHEGRRLEARDLYVCTSHDYQTLRSKLAYRLDHIAEDEFHTPEFELEFKNYYRHVVGMEKNYSEGVCLIVNNLVLMESKLNSWAYEALTWFSRLWRSELLHHLHKLQNPRDPALSTYGAKSLRDRFGSDCRSYGQTEPLASMDVGPKKGNLMYEAFRVHIDREQEAYKDTEYLTIENLRSYGGSILSQYVIPQMVSQIVEDFEGPYSWTFEGYGIGRG